MKHYELLKNDPAYWPDNSMYFLTDSTFLHFPYFSNESQKQIVLNQIKKIKESLGVPISAYSIAKNHYHLKFFLEKGVLLSKIKQLLRGGISYEYNKHYDNPYKEMWQTRKTVLITSEDMDWKVTGYIIGNLLKHKEVSTFTELKGNKFSSFWFMTDKYGFDEMTDLVKRVIITDEDSRGDIDLNNLKDIDLKFRRAEARKTLG